MKLAKTFLIATLGAALLGCAASPPVRHYLLDDGRTMTQGAPDGPKVAVVQIHLPDYLDRPQMAVRSSNHELLFNEFNRWAEPLSRQLPRLLARDLGEALDSARVLAAPLEAESFDADFKVALDIQRLDMVAGRGVELDAVWRLQARNQPASFGRSRSVEALSASPLDYSAIAAAQSRALQKVATDIAVAIKAWNREKPAR